MLSAGIDHRVLVNRVKLALADADVSIKKKKKKIQQYPAAKRDVAGVAFPAQWTSVAASSGPLWFSYTLPPGQFVCKAGAYCYAGVEIFAGPQSCRRIPQGTSIPTCHVLQGMQINLPPAPYFWGVSYVSGIPCRQRRSSSWCAFWRRLPADAIQAPAAAHQSGPGAISDNPRFYFV